MALIDTLRNAVKTVDKVTKSLQATVQYSKAVISTDGFGTVSYPNTVELRAIVDWKQKQLRTPEGVLSVSRASVTFLDVAALAAATETEGISDNDKIMLPDGTTGPILDMSGFIDPGTGQAIATEVFLG